MSDEKPKEQIAKKEPKRILMLADFSCTTGFAQVAHNIVQQLLVTNEYQIDIVGINFYGMPNEWQNIYPTVRLFPATIISNNDLFGRHGYLQMLSTGAYDLTFILQDTFIVETIAPDMMKIKKGLAEKKLKVFKWIYYYPIDATPKQNWIDNSVALADYPVAYTKYGLNESIAKVPSLEGKLIDIPHGVNISIFQPLPDELKTKFKHDYFVGRADNKYLVTNVNRNQPRKNIAQTLQIFSLFKKIVPNSVLYLHMKENDVGGGINEIARNFDLIPNEDYIIPTNFDEHTGVDVNIVNAIYNVSDVVMTTTYGEGWGLSMTEAMAARVPVIAPDHTSLTEMLADGRGSLVKSGVSQTDWIIMQSDNERRRPVANVADFVEKLVDLHHNPEKAKKQAEVAYDYVVKNLTWEIIGKKWRAVFNQALAATDKKTTDLGRNDPCHCGSGKKYKKCHYATDNG